MPPETPADNGVGVDGVTATGTPVLKSVDAFESSHAAGSSARENVLSATRTSAAAAAADTAEKVLIIHESAPQSSWMDSMLQMLL